MPFPFSPRCSLRRTGERSSRRTGRGAIAVVVTAVVAILSSACASTGGPYQGMNLDEVMEIGLQHLEAEEWDDAIEAFETVTFAAQGLESAAPARFYLAEAFYGDEQYITAAAEYRRFLERYPNHSLAPEASLGICESYVALSPIVPRDQRDTRRAYQECGVTALDFAGTDQARIAADHRDRMWEKLARKVFEGGEYYFRREFYDSAILYYEDVVENYPRSTAAPRALQRMYQSYVAIGYEEEASQTRQRLLDEYPESEAAQALGASQDSATAGDGSAG